MGMASAHNLITTGGEAEYNSIMKKEIVIIGGGFAGINLVRHLADGPGFHITLVDRNNYNAFPPLLYIRQWQRLGI